VNSTTQGSAKYTPHDVYEAIAEVELNLPVRDWTIGGLRVWPLLRNYHAFDLLTRKVYNTNSQIVRYSGRSSRLKQIGLALAKQHWMNLRDRAHKDHFHQSDVAILVNSSTRYFKVDGCWYNPYSDSFIKHLNNDGASTITLELTSDGKFLHPRFSSSVLIQHKMFIRSMWAKVQTALDRPSLPEVLEGFEDFLLIMTRRLGDGSQPVLQMLRFRARQVLAFEAYFSSLLAAIRPSVGMTSGYYSAENMGFIRACRRLGILTVEVQHGVQGDQHFAYRPWLGLPPDGYDTLPELFWSWGQAEHDTIESWTGNHRSSHRSIIGGNPCLHIYDGKGHSLRTRIADRIAALQSKRAKGLNILFTVQAFYDLPRTLLEGIRTSTPDWTWWIRVHPQYWETRAPLKHFFEQEGLANVLIDEPSDLPLVSLLENMDVHVTEFSSSVLEAATLGVPSVVINPMGLRLFPHLAATGVVTLAESGPELLQHISRQYEKVRELRHNRTDQEEVFRRGIETILDAVRKCKK
jgi:hypothetical protein